MLEQAIKRKRRTLETTPQGFPRKVAKIKPQLVERLVQRFTAMAPFVAVAQYRDHLRTRDFDHRLCYEIELAGGMEAEGDAELMDWLVGLVDR